MYPGREKPERGAAKSQEFAAKIRHRENLTSEAILATGRQRKRGIGMKENFISGVLSEPSERRTLNVLAA